MKGMDLKLINEVEGKILNIPLVSIVELEKKILVFIDLGSDAVAAGSYFVFYGSHKAVLISYPKSKFLEVL